MNGVIGMVQLLLNSELTSEQRTYAEVVQTSGRTLLALIDDILDLSKIEARKIVIEKLDFNLQIVIDEVIGILRMQANTKGIAIASRIAPETPLMLRGDPNRLRQVLTNLAANAIKFTEQGEVKVEVALQREEEGKVFVAFRRHGYRHRDAAGEDSGPVFAVRTSRRFHHPKIRRHGAGTGNFKATCGIDGRKNRPRKPGRQGIHVLVYHRL